MTPADVKSVPGKEFKVQWRGIKAIARIAVPLYRAGRLIGCCGNSGNVESWSRLDNHSEIEREKVKRQMQSHDDLSIIYSGNVRVFMDAAGADYFIQVCKGFEYCERIAHLLLIGYLSIVLSA
jgi:hypothetical protein